MFWGDNTWQIEQIGYSSEREGFFESIFSLANGYMGMRGYDEEKRDEKGYELCTFIAGIFDYFKPGMTDMVNVPNFNNFKVSANGSTFSFKDSMIIDYRRTLNMKSGTLSRSFIWEDEKGNRTKIESLKFLSISDKHIACIKYRITPLNYEGEIHLETGIDGSINNNPINDDQVKNDINPIAYLGPVKTGEDKSAGYLSALTKGTAYKIALAFCVEPSGIDLNYSEELKSEGRIITRKIKFYGKLQNEYEFVKYIAVFTSRDKVFEPLNEAIKAVLRVKNEGFDSIYNRNCELWQSKWDISDIKIEGDNISLQGIRYNIFELLQSCDEDNQHVSIGARGLTHSRYKGCYFWDTDIFMLPFFIYNNPNAAKSLMMFRYNTLAGARKNAAAQNVDGARYAWMCTIDGIEQCDTWDIGFSEAHITADVAYAVNEYGALTGDEDFIKDFGAEILIETARYWKSRFTYNRESDRYNLLFVKGPNEYGGVSNNNTYTIFMAVNNFKLAAYAITLLKSKYSLQWEALKGKLQFNENEIESWTDISNKVNINYNSEKKLYLEDDNFLKLEPMNINALKDGSRASYHKVCFDRLQRYRVLKQADVLLLMQLLPRLFSKEECRAAWELYEPITLHDSSLSFGTHAQFAANLNLINESYEYFVKCVRYDLDDIMENVGKEGLHMASMGSSWQVVFNGFGGISIREGLLYINPVLPPKWKNLSFSFVYQKNLFRMNITRDHTDVTLCKGSLDEEVKVIIKDKEICLKREKE